MAQGGKREVYARLRAREYYIYDPEQKMDPPFLGYELRGERLEQMPALPGGGIYSPLLGAELRPVAMGQSERRPVGVWLRVIDPATGQPIPIAEEEHRDLLMARSLLLQEEQARRAAEERASDETQARRAAEERARQAEETLARLLAAQQ